ncbi:MAG: OmpH family outer membrane protein [Muribaculaceae bacterium]|nr:OmpH family outer membrane protein [Muribaculaceae bacterium]
MLKKILLAVAVALPMFASAQSVKLGIVDTNAVFTVMPETTAAQTKITEVQKKYEDEFNRLQEELKRMVDDYQKMKEDELPAIKERKTREISDYQQKIQAFMQSADQDIAQQQQTLMAPIANKIKEAIESVGKENGFSMIQAYTPDQILFYASPVEDVTNLVKAKLGLK